MDFNVNLDRNVRRKIFFGKVCPKSTDGSSCVECEKASEFYRASNNTSSKEDRVALMEKARQLYARSKIFVNAIDTQDEDKSYPVRIYALPPSTYDDLMRQVKGLQILDNSINVVHPFKGRNILITKTGQGVQTRYSVQIDNRDTEIPNKQLLEQFKTGDVSGLHNLNKVTEFIDQNYMHIKQVDNETNIIRLLPPFDETKVIYAEVKFHRFTADYVLNQGNESSDQSSFTTPSPSPSQSSNKSTVDEYDPFSVSDEVSAATPNLTPVVEEDDIPNFSSVEPTPAPNTSGGSQQAVENLMAKMEDLEKN